MSTTAITPTHTQAFDPNQAQNAAEIEKQFAVKAVEHAQTYWNLLGAIPPRDLKLTSVDDELYEAVLEAFPPADKPKEGVKTFDYTKLDEDMMKTPDGKERWRAFISKFENKVKDFNFGSLIRTDASGEYTERNTMFVTRIQFYAIEIVRNRHGLNDASCEIAKKDAEEERQKKEKKKKEKEERRAAKEKERLEKEAQEKAATEKESA
ncbi:DUF757-domain-containing protein [Cylindrobasidium torrendii FP15055 ss-10]|uniref:DUF757-domain-containing protein n=1 Tax=Cylindrobasidium torrendii FP15055 ss-10 TaxID=1314674 RepID=A0A0D7B8W1_9AGAR|nr:DUF757-domain-containing protein [Cylindrobasidium torrendii FP15055 ss-10]